MLNNALIRSEITAHQIVKTAVFALVAIIERVSRYSYPDDLI